MTSAWPCSINILSILVSIILVFITAYAPCSEYKLGLRKAQCLIRLAQYKEGLRALQQCQAALDFSKLSDDKKGAIVKDINALEIEAGKLERKSSIDVKDSTLLELNNPELPGASPKLAVEVSNDKVKGRFVTAKEDIEVVSFLMSSVLSFPLKRWERFYSVSLPTAVSFSLLTTPATAAPAWHSWWLLYPAGSAPRPDTAVGHAGTQPGQVTTSMSVDSWTCCTVWA